jgi:UDP-N-acetylmuramyl pentapeptide phosphotransferase/UDP-N-acetylglucosamine-1-phosphate transferase
MTFYYLFFIAIFILTLLLLYIYKNISNKLNLLDIPNHLSVHKKITPTGAGVVFLIIFLLVIETSTIKEIFKINNPKNYYIFFLSLIFLTLMSFYDDLKKIHPVTRLFFQITTIFFCTTLFKTDLINIPIKLVIFLIIYFWVYIINIINFSDGVDGFLTTNSINFFLCILIFYYINDINNFVYFVSLTCLPILGAYLIFNKPNATLFMGDAGSIFLGFLIGYVSIQLILIERIDIIISLLSYTFLDCTLTIIRKILNKQTPWARLFDYYFLIPIKNNESHKSVFYSNLIYNLIILVIVILQIIFEIKVLCIFSVLLSILLIYYYKSFSKKIY